MKNFKFLIRLDENRNGVGNSIKCKLVNFIFNSASLLSEPQLIYAFNEILSSTRNVERTINFFRSSVTELLISDASMSLIRPISLGASSLCSF